MPIPLNQNNSRPSVKLPTIGAGVEVCIIGMRQIAWTEFGTDRPKVGTNGQPRKQLRLTGIVVSQQGAMTGPQGQERPVAIGETVDLYLHGHQWGSFIEAEKALNTAGLQMQVGDVLLQHYTHNEPSSQAGANDKRVKACTLRRARPDEQHWVAQAEQAYYALGFDKADPDAMAGAPDTAEPTSPYGQAAPQFASTAPYGGNVAQPQYQQPQQQAYAPVQQPAYGQPAPQQPQQGYAPQTAAQPGYNPQSQTGF